MKKKPKTFGLWKNGYEETAPGKRKAKRKNNALALNDKQGELSPASNYNSMQNNLK